MPRKKGQSVGKTLKELKKDNKKKGNARGAGGKVRSKKQMLAIALSVAGKARKRKK